MGDRYLFKAKRADNGDWVEGFYVPLKGGSHHSHHIFTGVLDITGLYPVWIRYEIDSSTLCQCTGLKDSTKWHQLAEEEQEAFLSTWNEKEKRKNIESDWQGRLIWENDIVNCQKRGAGFYNSVIVWNEEGYWGAKIRGFSETENPCIFPMILPKPHNDVEITSKDYEVVRSIFDNPELLEV